jgi:hypothetical protein
MVYWPNQSLLVWNERIESFFFVWSNNNGARARSSSLSAVGVCAHSYDAHVRTMPSPVMLISFCAFSEYFIAVGEQGTDSVSLSAFFYDAKFPSTSSHTVIGIIPRLLLQRLISLHTFSKWV